jgi:hypothetical protein
LSLEQAGLVWFDFRATWFGLRTTWLGLHVEQHGLVWFGLVLEPPGLNWFPNSSVLIIIQVLSRWSPAEMDNDVTFPKERQRHFKFM